MYKPVDGDATHIKYGNDDAKQVTGNTKWVSHVQQFFQYNDWYRKNLLRM